MLFFIIFLCCQQNYSQEDKLNKAVELRAVNPYAALALMDSAVKHTQTKNDPYTWTLRAFIYYELYKKTDKLKLYSVFRDSILSSIERSFQLKPDSENIINNMRMLKTLYLGYLKIMKNQLEDSFNIKNTYVALNKYKALRLKVDSNSSILAVECEVRMAVISSALERYSQKWQKNKTVDTTEFIFINNEIKTLHQLSTTIPDPIDKELSMMDKNYLKEEKKTVDKLMLSKNLMLNEALLNNNYNVVIKNKYQNEVIQKQIQLALSNQQNQLALLKAEKQKDEIELLNSNMAISQFQVERQKSSNELLQKEKKLQIALIEKQKIESTKQEEELGQQRFARNISLAGILLLFVIIFLIYRNLALNKKQNKIILAQKHEVENQNQIISKQKHLVEEKHKEITDSINYAERIQRSFMATKDMLDEHLKEYFVFFKPKDVVSGDFYWASSIHRNDERANVASKIFYLCTADSTGHGVPGAIMSLLNIASLEKAIEQHHHTSDILNHTRKTIIERLKKDGSKVGGKDGMDCSLIAFNFSENKLFYSAANNPIWIVRNNQLLEFEPDRMPVGKHDKDYLPFTQHEVELIKGDVIYTLTDGMPDQFGGERGKKFMYKKLKELLISIASMPMHAQKNKIENTLKNWMGENEQVDDITLIGVKV